MLDDAYSGVLGGHDMLHDGCMEGYVLNGRCFWRFSASCSILDTL